MHELIITAEELRELGQRILGGFGIPKTDIQVTVESLVQSDLRGVHSHGVQRLRWYAERLRNGGTNPHANVRVVAETDSTALVDGDNGLGQVISQHAMELTIAKAKTHGVGIVGVRRSHHFGACAFWVQKALEHDLIGIVTTNGGAILAPWGGLTPSMGTNPLGVAIPAGVEPPIVIDMATSVVAGGKLDMAISKGESIPLGWALNAHGEPTTDPRAGREGLLLPIGGHKGYGLTLAFEVIAAVLTGAQFARHVPAPAATSKSMGVGHYFQALRIDAFLSSAEFKSRMDDLIRQMKSTPPVPGHGRVYLPGEIEFETRERYLRQGIPLPASVISDLHELAGQSP